ncbi:hypothetical protein FOZ62_000361 [Perkinsus olseni]|uniref:Uncharacterized protein n=1 Tax=Perkinsus olseni TaxID=32597 RepID=A0A7J6UB29_PEROL|nr:hypothetical protein FOZ62_000361 [Perkinsus olseni]
MLTSFQGPYIFVSEGLTETVLELSSSDGEARNPLGSEPQLSPEVNLRRKFCARSIKIVGALLRYSIRSPSSVLQRFISLFGFHGKMSGTSLDSSASLDSSTADESPASLKAIANLTRRVASTFGDDKTPMSKVRNSRAPRKNKPSTDGYCNYICCQHVTCGVQLRAILDCSIEQTRVRIYRNRELHSHRQTAVEESPTDEGAAGGKKYVKVPAHLDLAMAQASVLLVGKTYKIVRSLTLSCKKVLQK